LFELPSEFKPLEDILKCAPANLPNGEKGLLAQGKLGSVMANELPLLDCDEYKDSRILNALFREYFYLASMYLIEPRDLNLRKTGEH